MSKKQKGTLAFLYNTVLGRVILRLLTARWVSRLAGAFCDSALSRPLIKGFVQKNSIDLSEYTATAFKSFNACFTRKIRPELRPICKNKNVLISPCDGLLSAYKIEKDMVFPAKQSEYSVADFLQNKALAKEFEDGTLLVFRLCVEHYHRYCYIDNGTKGENIFIAGKLHTVRPIALQSRPVFCENCREYTVMQTESFGKVIQCEIGAMLVGKIKNHDGACSFERGKEKGMFLYGGSTVVLMLKKDAVNIPDAFFEKTKNGEEIPVKYGSALASAMVKI